MRQRGRINMRIRTWRLTAVIEFPLCAGDANRVAALIQNEDCLQCHAVNGVGASHGSPQEGPDLANRLASAYTPTAVASARWNHTPAMWAALLMTQRLGSCIWHVQNPKIWATRRSYGRGLRWQGMCMGTVLRRASRHWAWLARLPFKSNLEETIIF